MHFENKSIRGKIDGSKFFMAMAIAWILILTYHTACFASTVVLQWDGNTDTNAAGYKVYYQANSSTQPFQGTGAAQGAAPVDVHNQTTATISGLDPAHAYYFAVTTYNTSGSESIYSNLVRVPELVSPTVSLSYPVANTSVSGSVSVTASASDNVGVTKVEFYVNGVRQATDTSTPYLYSWNTSSLTAGKYTLMAKAYDAAGNIGQSAKVSVTVAKDTTAPSVFMMTPTSNSSVSGSFKITANANDNVGVSKVEFYEDGVLLAATNVAPYSYTWNTATVVNGAHSLVAKAYDTSNNVGKSSLVQVTVRNSTSDATAPLISITAPTGGAAFTAPAAIPITATATAGTGATVSRVDFYAGTRLLGSATTSPYRFTWSSVAAGSYSLTARVTNSLNKTATSSPVVLTVAASGLPTPWATRDIGSTGISGSASYLNGTFSLKGSGTDIWGSADSFRYAYHSLKGDGQIIARVASQQNTNIWAKGGVMIRETLAANSKQALMALAPGIGATFQRRLTAGGTSVNTTGPGVRAPYWVKLVRRGNTFSGYISSNGVSWTFVGGSTINMASSVYIGLAVTSHNNSALCKVTMDGVQ